MSEVPRWFDDVLAVVEAIEAGRYPRVERWPHRFVEAAPDTAPPIVAQWIEETARAGGQGTPESVAAMRRLLAHLLGLEGHDAGAEAVVAYPTEVRWKAFVDATPGDPDDRVRQALYRVLVAGGTVDALVSALSRRGPGPVLEPIARTAMLSQFDFADRAGRTRVLARRKGWLRLAILAAEARGHGCCVGMFGLELEALEAEGRDDRQAQA